MSGDSVDLYEEVARAARVVYAGGGHRGVDPLKIFINEFCHPSVSSFGAEGQSAQLSCLLPFLIFPYFSGST